jgi:hypothetical protein
VHGPTVPLSTMVTGQSAVGIGAAVGMAIGGLVVIAATGAQEQRSNRQLDSGPTCRLASSPEAGPGATVGTLNHGYPLLQHEDTAPMRRLIATQGTAPDPSAWAGQRAPHGKERQHIPVGPDPHRRTPDPYTYKSGAFGQVRTLARSQNKEDPGMSRGPVLTCVWALSFTSCSDGDPQLVAHGIRYRAEHDAKSCNPCIYRGKDTSLATVLTGDVPSQHLMRPVPSVGRRRQGHPAGDAPAGSAGKQCTHAERHAILILPSTRSFPCTPRIRRSRAPGHKNIVSATDIRRLQALYSLCPWAHMSGPSPFVHAPFSYKRGDMRCYTHTQS